MSRDKSWRNPGLSDFMKYGVKCQDFKNQVKVSGTLDDLNYQSHSGPSKLSCVFPLLPHYLPVELFKLFFI